MASGPTKPKDSAEKAYADAAAKAGPAKAAVPAKPAPAKKPVPVKKAAPKPVTKPLPEVAAPVVPVAEAPEPAAPVELPAPALAAVEVEVPVAAAPEPEPPVEEALPPVPTITELKEKIMATAKTTDFTKPVSDAIGEIQSKATAAYEKGTEALSEATEFAKGNVEALVESGKIYAAGVQDLGKSYVEEAKSAYETLTADFKEIAAIKSPTELFQLQGKIARRNFDALVATGSKHTEAFVKLANDSFAPISGRVNLAAEKLAKVA